MKILLTGATGVMGRRAVPLLVAAGHDVTAAVRSEAAANRAKQLGAHPRMVNLFDLTEVRSALRGADAVINLATSIPPATRVALPWAWDENSRIRRDASRVIAEAALAEGTSRYVQESFAPIYEDAGDRWIDETDPVRTTSHTHSVLDAEASVRRFIEQSPPGASGVVLRFGYFYGPDSDFTRQMLQGARVGIAMAFGAETGFVSPIAHDDTATAIVAALAAPSGTYNVCDDEPVTRRDFYDTLARVAGGRSPIFPPAMLGRLFGSVGDVLSRSQRISNRRFRDATGWTPMFPSFREGAATLSLLVTR